MKKQRQKWVCFLAVLTLVLAVLCACGTQPEQEEEPAPVQETEPKGTEASAGNTVDMGDYVLTLPKDCTQQAREDRGLSFLCDGAPVGGVQTLDCPGADQVDWDDLTGYKEVLPTLWSQFLEEGREPLTTSPLPPRAAERTWRSAWSPTSAAKATTFLPQGTRFTISGSAIPTPCPPMM
ncbi:MAG: hypothetical protein ACLSCQ_04470 [Evtepia gabavorous]